MFQYLRKIWLRRALVLGVALSIHLVGGMWLWHGRIDISAHSTGASTSPLEVRFIEVPQKRRVLKARAPRSASAANLSKRHAEIAVAAHQQSALSMEVARDLSGDKVASTAIASTGTAHEVAIKPSSVGPTTWSNRVSGSERFATGADISRRAARLPGASSVRGAPSLRMVDPRTQGVAGVVRLIGSVTGAVDRHCVDLDTWEGMTPDERVAHGVSEQDLVTARDTYGCVSRQGRGA